MGEGKEERILKEIVLQIGIEILLESGFPFMTSGVYMLRRCQQAKKKRYYQLGVLLFNRRIYPKWVSLTSPFEAVILHDPAPTLGPALLLKAGLRLPVICLATLVQPWCGSGPGHHSLLLFVCHKPSYPSGVPTGISHTCSLAGLPKCYLGSDGKLVDRC